MPLGFIRIEWNRDFQAIFSIHQAKNHSILCTNRLHVSDKCKFIFDNTSVFCYGMWFHITPTVHAVGFDHVHDGFVVTSLALVVLTSLIYPIVQMIGYRVHFVSCDIKKETHIRFPVVKIL